MWVELVTLPIVCAFGYFLLPFGWRRLTETRLSWRCRDQRAIVLTYDDGPGVLLTPKLIDLMARHDVRGSFFALGRCVARYPQVLRQVEAGGHMIGSHSYDHLNAWKASPFKVWKDVDRGIRAVREVGAGVEYFRPPYGKISLIGLVQAWIRGVKLGWWTINSQDVGDRRSVEDVLAEISRRGGGVVLMHDLDRHDEPEGEVGHTEHVLALTEAIINFARERGYVIKPLSELLIPQECETVASEVSHA